MYGWPFNSNRSHNSVMRIGHSSIFKQQDVTETDMIGALARQIRRSLSSGVGNPFLYFIPSLVIVPISESPAPATNCLNACISRGYSFAGVEYSVSQTKLSRAGCICLTPL